MSDQPPQIPAAAVPQPPPLKPALAPGVKSQVMLPNARQPAGPGLADGRATFTPASKPPLGAPKPRLRAIEPSPAVATCKVPVFSSVDAVPGFSPVHLVFSGVAAAVAITAAILIFLKF